MVLPIDWQDDQAIARLFRWLTTAGVGCAFGSRPIGWYQLHQCAAYDVVLQEAREALKMSTSDQRPLRFKYSTDGYMYVYNDDPTTPRRNRGWIAFASIRALSDKTDRKARS